MAPDTQGELRRAGPHVALQIENEMAGANTSVGHHAPRPPAMAMRRIRSRHPAPSQPGLADAVRRFLLSAVFRQAVQLTAGEIFVALFVLVRPLAYQQSCLANIFYVAAMVIVSKDGTVGSRLLGAASILGYLWAGTLMGGAVVSLAHAPGVAYSIFLCIFAVIGLIPTAAARVVIGPLGVLLCLGYGIVIIQFGHVWPARALWRRGVGYLLLDGVVAAGGCAVGGLVVLPTLARDELCAVTARAVQGLGQCISGYAGYIFASRPPCAAAAGSAAPAAAATGRPHLVTVSGWPSSAAAGRYAPSADGSCHSHRDTAPGGGSQQLPASRRTGGQLVPTPTAQAKAAMEGGMKRDPSAEQAVRADQRTSREESKASQFWSAAGEEHGDEEGWRQAIQEASDPALQAHARFQGRPGAPPVKAIRPLLTLARQLLDEAQAEPPLLDLRARVRLAPWPGLLRALEGLLLKTAALESLLEGDDCVLEGGALASVLGHDCLPAFRLVYAAIAAALAELADALRSLPCSDQARRHPPLFAPAWPMLEAELATALHAAISAYWRFFDSMQPARPAYEVRALLYVATLTAAIMEAMERVEAAGVAVLAAQVALPPPWRLLRACCPRGAGVGSASSSPGSSVRVRGGGQPCILPVVAPGGDDATAAIRAALHELVRHSLDRQAAALEREASLTRTPRSFRILWEQRPVVQRYSMTRISAQQAGNGRTLQLDQRSTAPGGTETVDPASPEKLAGGSSAVSPQKAGLAAKAAKSGAGKQAGGTYMDDRGMRRLAHPIGGRWRTLRPWLANEVAWLRPLLLELCGAPLYRAWAGLLRRTLPATLKSPPRLRHALRHGRRFQFFLKYYCATAGVMVAVVALGLNTGVRTWNPLYLYITVAVVMSEKVEHTLSRGVMRILGTVLGATLGFVVMLRPAMATNPYGLATVMGAVAFLGGCALGSPFKYAVFLTLITTDSVIMCQYRPEPGAHGSPHYYYARIVNIALGVLIVQVVEQIRPWYASIHALEALGGAFHAATEVTARFYEVFRRELRRAAAVEDTGEFEMLEKESLEELEEDLVAQRIARPLAAVTASLARETVQWRHGPLALPPIVARLAGALQVLLERLVALEAVVLQAPIVSGRFTGFPFVAFFKPLHPLLRRSMDALTQLGAATCLLLNCEEGASPERVWKCLNELTEARLAVRHRYLALLDAYVHGGDQSAAGSHCSAASNPALVSATSSPATSASDASSPAPGDSNSPTARRPDGRGAPPHHVDGEKPHATATTAGSKLCAQDIAAAAPGASLPQPESPALCLSARPEHVGEQGQPGGQPARVDMLPAAATAREAGGQAEAAQWASLPLLPAQQLAVQHPHGGDQGRQGGAARPTAACRTLDDTTRLGSFLFALSKVMDKAALLARMAAEDPFVVERCRHSDRWLHWHLWFGS